MPELRDINCKSVFKRYWRLWKYIGLAPDRNKYLCAFDIFLSIAFTFWFPFHLMIGLFQSRTLEEALSNLVMNATSVACAIKHIILRRKLAQMHHISESLGELDKRIQQEPDEQYYFKNVMLRNAQRITNGFIYFFLGTNLAIVVKIAVNGRELLYPAWFPFDWNGFLHTFIAAVTYQFLGLQVMIVQNLANDIYGPLNLCLIAGHVHLLCLRIEKLGYISDVDLSPKQRYAKLVACIDDYKELMRLLKLTESTISYVYFTQFIVTGTNIVIAVICMMFFTDNFTVYFSYVMIIIAIAIELFPACYYGTVLSLEFERLPYAVFSCNWMDQQLGFRRSIVIFGEQSMRSVEVVAGNMFRLDLESFIAASKMAYSVFTLLRTIK